MSHLGRGELAPTHLRIYANHTAIVDFSDAQAFSPQMNISLLDGQDGVTEYPVRVPSFATVTSLSLFFVSSSSMRTLDIYWRTSLCSRIRWAERLPVCITLALRETYAELCANLVVNLKCQLQTLQTLVLSTKLLKEQLRGIPLYVRGSLLTWAY
jgi:hypothetical protein